MVVDDAGEALGGRAPFTAAHFERWLTLFHKTLELAGSAQSPPGRRPCRQRRARASTATTTGGGACLLSGWHTSSTPNSDPRARPIPMRWSFVPGPKDRWIRLVPRAVTGRRLGRSAPAAASGEREPAENPYWRLSASS